MITSILFFTAFAAAPALDVAVLPVRGSSEATKLVEETLKNVQGVRVIALGDVDRVLGTESANKLAACTEDRCVIDAIRPVRADGIIAGSIDDDDGRTLLRLRLIVSSTTAQLTAGRTTHDLDSAGLASAIGAAISELMPAQAGQSFGLLELANAPPDAELQLDGVIYGVLAGDTTTLRVRAGAHRIAVRAPGHDSFATEARVSLGQKTRVELELEKRRSNSPYIVAGAGVAAGLAGVLLGVVASSTANEWKDACAGAHCEAGFTRQRYDDERSNVERYRVSANALYVVSIAAVTAGVVWYALDPGVE